MSLPRSTPAEQGVDRRGVDAFVDAVAHLDEAELHSLMVLRHGQVVAEAWWEPYRPDTPHLLYSLSKSFTSTALGMAVEEGLVDLDAAVLSYFPELNHRITNERSRSMLVRHVAAMASGHDTDTAAAALAAGDGDMLLGLLLIPPDHDPGTVFAYNQPCTYALSAVISRATDQSLTSYLKPRLLEPLGISSYGWITDRVGRQIGFSGLHATTEAIASLGQLYLDQGRWQGRSLLRPDWVAEATRMHITTAEQEENPDWRQGYGFQFWRSRHGYRGDGAYGQYMIILPEADAVIAITSQSPDMQGVLDAVWAHLLPAFDGAGAVPAGAWVPGPLVLAPSATSATTSRSFPDAVLTPSDAESKTLLRSVQIQNGRLVLADDGPELTVTLGFPGSWTATGPVYTDHSWVDGALLQVDVVFAETPHRLILRLDPAASQFSASWLAQPLHRVPLAQMRMPRPDRTLEAHKMTAGAAPLPPFHLAIPVHDIEIARHFYGEVLGFGRGRSDERWTDWDVAGHQLVTHQVDDYSRAAVAGTNLVDGHEVPVPHFGLVLSVEGFQELAQRLVRADVSFIIEPYVRFAGEPGEQWTMFFLDPTGNALEFKAFRDLTQLFAT